MSRKVAVRSAESGALTAAQIEPRISSPARTASATRGIVKPSSPLAGGSTKSGSRVRYSSRKMPRSSSSRVRATDTSRLMIVPIRDGSASS